MLLASLAVVLRLVPAAATVSPALKLCACALAGTAAALTAAGATLPLERSLYLLIAAAAALGGAFLGVALLPRSLGRTDRTPGNVPYPSVP